MITVIGVILADVLVLLLYAYHYRQELGLTVNGSHDLPVVRKKPQQVVGAAAGDQANRGQQVTGRR